MHPFPPEHAPQTPAQWAVRWHGLALGVVLFAAVPLVHVLWHGVLGRDVPILRTRSQVRPPAPAVDAVLDGTWMLAKERQLREDSPITWWLRGVWNEARYRLGVPRSKQVHVGKDEWFFSMEEVHQDRAAFDRAMPARRKFFAEVRSLVEGAGAQLFVSVLPDKARLYPELCYPDGTLPAGKRGAYAAILADLAASGIATVDIAAALAAARAADPATELWYRRDTHWRPQGALQWGLCVGGALEQRYAALLGPRSAAVLKGPETVRVVGDLPANLGLLTVELPDPVNEWRTTPMSFLTERLAETRAYFGLELRRGDASVVMDQKDPAAPVLVLGASFAEENGVTALAFALQRPVRSYIRRGASCLGALRDAVPELRAGTKARVVVWELVERGLFEPAWQAPVL
jgi:hypothetical protein